MNALTAEELLAWADRTATEWRALLTAHPEALAFPCEINDGETVADLIHHIVGAELGYATRLCSAPALAREDVPRGTAETLYATHDRAMAMLRDLLLQDDVDWEELIEFKTGTAGAFRATRRTVFVHLVMHSIRHHAQLATVVRQSGVRADFEMDYLFMGVQ